MTDGDRIWTHTEHMAWGWKNLINGVQVGFWLGVIVCLSLYLAIGSGK